MLEKVPTIPATVHTRKSRRSTCHRALFSLPEQAEHRRQQDDGPLEEQEKVGAGVQSYAMVQGKEVADLALPLEEGQEPGRHQPEDPQHPEGGSQGLERGGSFV